MAKTEPHTFRLTRLKLTNWRNFQSADVLLAKRAFFIGPNASGKSNLLDAIRFLRDIVKPIAGGFSTALEVRDGLRAVRCLQARRVSYVEIDVDIGNDEHPTCWSYRIRFTRFGREQFPSVEEEEIKKDGRLVLEQRRSGDTPEPFRFSQSLIQQATNQAKFRELVEFFSSIRYLHVVPQIVRDPRRALDRTEDPYGGDLLKRINETTPRTREARLRRVAEALKIAVPQFVDLKLDHDKEGRPHLKAGFKHWRPNPTYQTEEVFSDGTLRLIGFLWSLGEKDGPLLLEEPELSLHPDVVRQLPSMIARMQRLSGRQVCMTTHSDALVGADGVGLHEVHRLIPGENGTTIETAGNNPQIRTLVESGLSVGEAAMPLARPKGVEQLSLFDAVGS
ncbi:AAA family ATPase [Bradyrhizobium iriomotense]|uniref:AAA family ATPase n=1 Tax=Bradyrhizobium iriomotense TaxID=441950 RepID=UPI001B8A4976|nr:ATP-binding protein [Bradyrhizobium iriomotense]MBR0780179.1 AAA family ATPase [Bradyrhizobium iriomotense]